MGTLVWLFLVQEKVYIDRLDKEKPVYLEAIKIYKKAATLMGSEPQAALQILGELLEKFDSPDRPGPKICERVLSIEVQAGEREDHPFLPYQLRGRIRIKMAKLAASKEEMRKGWSGAVEDLTKSLDRGVISSKEDLEVALRELAKLPPPEAPKPRSQIEAEWAQNWSRLKGDLGPDRFSSGDGTQVERAGALLRRMPAEASPKEASLAKAWLAGQVENVQLKVAAMSRSQAKATLAWCQALAQAIDGVEPLKSVAETLGRVRAESAQRAEFRGSFCLKIGPCPYAQGLRLYREGEEIPLRGRVTPLVLPDLEIGDYKIEMVNPESGPKTFTIQANELKVGRTFFLTGRMKEGVFTLSESP